MTKWMKLLLRIMDGEQNISSPFHEDGILQSIVVMHDENDRIGYLLFWCSVTHKGVMSGRLGVPEKVKYVLSKDLETLNMPDIQLQSVKF